MLPVTRAWQGVCQEETLACAANSGRSPGKSGAFALRLVTEVGRIVHSDSSA